MRRLIPVILPALLLGNAALAADSILVKKPMVGCVDEKTINTFIGYEYNKDQKGVTAMIASGKCKVIQPGETISRLWPGVMIAGIEYRGERLFARADEMRR